MQLNCVFTDQQVFWKSSLIDFMNFDKLALVANFIKLWIELEINFALIFALRTWDKYGGISIFSNIDGDSTLIDKKGKRKEGKGL